MLDKLKVIKVILHPLYNFLIRAEIVSSKRYRISALRQEYNKWKRMCNYRKDNICKSRYEIYDNINRDIIKGDSIDFLEFGVYKGDSIKYWLNLNKNPASRFFGFDSFEGLPEKWDYWYEKPLPKCTFDIKDKVPVIADKRIVLIKGLFQTSLEPFLKNFTPKNRLVIHMDADLYSSTLFVLTSINPFIVPGTILIFDEFFILLDEFSAFVDYTRAYYKHYELFAYTKNCEQIAIIIK